MSLFDFLCRACGYTNLDVFSNKVVDKAFFDKKGKPLLCEKCGSMDLERIYNGRVTHDYKCKGFYSTDK